MPGIIFFRIVFTVILSGILVGTESCCALETRHEKISIKKIVFLYFIIDSVKINHLLS